MTTNNKINITLTDLTLLRDGRIRYSLSDGTFTVCGSSVTHEHLKNDFFNVIKELIQGSPVYRKDSIDFSNPRWIKFHVQMVIDCCLYSAMIDRHSNEKVDIKVKELDQWAFTVANYINSEGEVSCSLIFGDTPNNLQGHAGDQKDEQTGYNWVYKLAEIIFDGDAWDPEQQGINFISETLQNDTVVKVELNVVRAVGNAFVNGKIGDINIRIFKHQNIQVYYTWDDKYPERPDIFQLWQKEKLIDYLNNVVNICITNS